MDYLYKIKFLNSPLAGRELFLREGPFSIGSGDCDVYVALLEGDATEIVFEVGSQGVSLPAAGKLWCDGVGQTLEAGEYLPQGVCLDIAGVQFALGETESSLDPVVAVARRQDVTIQAAGSKVFQKIALLLAVVSIAVLGGSVYWVNRAQPEVDAILSYAEVQKKVTEFQKKTSLEGINFNWQKNGVVKISGQCKSEKNLQPVLALFKSNNINYALDAVCDDRLIKNVTDVLQLNGFDRVLAYMDKTPGKVIISGEVEEDHRWQQVVNLLNDVQGLRSWTVKSVNDKELVDLINALRKSELLPMLSVQRVDERIVVSGHLNNRDRDALYSLIRDHMRTFPGTQEIVYQNINTSSSALGIFPAPIVSVGGNSEFPYVILQDGTRLQKGAVLPGGYQIANIDSINGIELSKRGGLLHLPLGL